MRTHVGVVNISNMNVGFPLLNERHVIGEDAFVEMVVWALPASLEGSSHKFKYRFALVVPGECVLRFYNEGGKGDHKHMGPKEIPYVFTTPQDLLDDFWKEVDHWRR